MNPNRAVQIFEELSDPLRRYYNHEEWGLPGGAQFRAIQGGATTQLTYETAFQSMRMFGRFARPKEAPNHINPGAPDGGRARPYQFAVKLRSDPRRFEGY